MGKAHEALARCEQRYTIKQFYWKIIVIHNTILFLYIILYHSYMHNKYLIFLPYKGRHNYHFIIRMIYMNY